MTSKCTGCSTPQPLLHLCKCGELHYYCDHCRPWRTKCSIFAPYVLTGPQFVELGAGCNSCRGPSHDLLLCVSEQKCRHYYCQNCHKFALLCPTTSLHFSSNISIRFSSASHREALRLAAANPNAAPPSAPPAPDVSMAVAPPVMATIVSLPVPPPPPPPPQLEAADVSSPSYTSVAPQSRPLRKASKPKRFSPYDLDEEQKKAPVCQVEIRIGDRQGLLCSAPVFEAGTGMCRKHCFYKRKHALGSSSLDAYSSSSSSSVSTVSSPVVPPQTAAPSPSASP